MRNRNTLVRGKYWSKMALGAFELHYTGPASLAHSGNNNCTLLRGKTIMMALGKGIEGKAHLTTE